MRKDETVPAEKKNTKLRLKTACSKFAKRPIDGFTLLEIIVSISLVSVLAVSMIQFSETALNKSSAPLRMNQQRVALDAVLEKMTADYKWVLLTDATPLETFRSRVENGNNSANNPYFGAYIIETKYVNFSQQESDFREETAACISDCNILKIVIHKGDQYLTALFTR